MTSPSPAPLRRGRHNGATGGNSTLGSLTPDAAPWQKTAMLAVMSRKNFLTRMSSSSSASKTPDRLPCVASHLRVCDACRTEHDGPLDAVREFGQIEPE
jgi:hypothetical protein